ncbi:MAG: hypothetical protein HYY03_09805 [Chloroflexi bacterium]|nr:hypothetical protein [Chloroflexota bacterium]
MLRPAAGRAQGATTLGVDVVADTNSAASLGTPQSCLEVSVGDSFPVDIYITNAQGLRAWELRFGFDHNVLQIVDQDYSKFLLSTDPKGSIFPSLFVGETADRYFLAAHEFRGTPDTGSGVLARLTMQAVAHGKSPVKIVIDPSYFRPRLTDANGEAAFSGPVSQGEVAVGQTCSGAPPPNATSGPTSTPGTQPGATQQPPAPTPPNGQSSNPVSSPAVGAVGGPDPGDEPSTSSGDNGGGTGPSDPGAGASRQTSGQDPNDGQAATATSEGGSSGFPFWLLAPAVGGAVALTAAFALTLRRLRGRS